MLPSWVCFPDTMTLQQRKCVCWYSTVELSLGVMLKRCLFWMAGWRPMLSLCFGPHLSIWLFVSSADPVFLGQDLRVLRWNCFRGKWDWYCPSDFQNHMWIIRAEYFNRSKKLYVLAMQWTVELFYEACLLTYKLNNLNWFDTWTHIFWIFVFVFITISRSHYLKHCHEL